jgi:perosamine synthetase
MNSGTATLHCALKALGIKEGDEVISPAYTVAMNTTATLHAGATPVYADIDPNTFTIDPEDMESKITKKTKAIQVVSIHGLPCDMAKINKISKKYNIPIVEDHAQTFLSKYNNNTVGVSNAFSSWSFETTKHMSCGEGGVLATNDEALGTLARKIGGHGFKNLTADGGAIKFGSKVNIMNPKYKRHDTLGWNYRMPEFNAAIALAQLEQLDNKVSTRIKVANEYLRVIKNIEFIIPQSVPHNYTHSYYSLACKWEHPSISWFEFRDKFIELGGSGFYGACSIPYQEPLMVNLNLKGGCPIAEQVQSKIMQFKTNDTDESIINKEITAFEKAINWAK